MLRQQHRQSHVLRPLQQDFPEDLPHALTLPVEEEKDRGETILVRTKPSGQLQTDMNYCFFLFCFFKMVYDMAVNYMFVLLILAL